MMMKNEQIDIWKKETIENVRKGEIPWKFEYGPVNRERVVDSIRYWRKLIKDEKLIIKNVPDLHLVNNDFNDLDYQSPIFEKLKRKLLSMEKIS